MANFDSLFDAALRVRANAYAPYSNFAVGAALRSSSGAVYVGCNVENAAFPEGTCAEAGAIAAMVAAGDTVIEEVVVVAESSAPCTPCGGCRQKLREFSAADVPVHVCGLQGEELCLTVGELLPHDFGAGNL